MSRYAAGTSARGVIMAKYILDDPKACAKKIGVPLIDWPGNCYGIACLFRDKGVVAKSACRAVYGHYRGLVAHGTFFFPAYAKAGFVRHGWLYFPEEPSIVDPTRWVFEGREPYVYIGAPSVEYDEGGDQIRAALMKPPPPFDPKDRREGMNLRMFPATAREFLRKLLGPAVGPHGKLSVMQVVWIANLPYAVLGPAAKAVYTALDRADQGALIPIDNAIRVGLREAP